MSDVMGPIGPQGSQGREGPPGTPAQEGFRFKDYIELLMAIAALFVAAAAIFIAFRSDTRELSSQLSKTQDQLNVLSLQTQTQVNVLNSQTQGLSRQLVEAFGPKTLYSRRATLDEVSFVSVSCDEGDLGIGGACWVSDGTGEVGSQALTNNGFRLSNREFECQWNGNTARKQVVVWCLKKPDPDT